MNQRKFPELEQDLNLRFEKVYWLSQKSDQEDQFHEPPQKMIRLEKRKQFLRKSKLCPPKNQVTNAQTLNLDPTS